jgi:ribosomal-protein-alanine N-acetyltransferase
MKIAHAAAAEAPLLASLHARCFAQAWDAKAFAELLKLENVFAFIVHEGETAAGFIMIRVAADEAECLSIGVLPEYRKQGLAHELVLAAAQRAFGVGARTLFLEVDVNNAPARALYRKLGFDEAGQRRGYYRSCESLADALVLRRVLPIPRMGIVVELHYSAGAENSCVDEPD